MRVCMDEVDCSFGFSFRNISNHASIVRRVRPTDSKIDDTCRLTTKAEAHETLVDNEPASPQGRKY